MGTSPCHLLWGGVWINAVRHNKIDRVPTTRAAAAAAWGDQEAPRVVASGMTTKERAKAKEDKTGYLAIVEATKVVAEEVVVVIARGATAEKEASRLHRGLLAQRQRLPQLPRKPLLLTGHKTSTPAKALSTWCA